MICEFHGYHGQIHNNEVTNRLLLIGESGIDLRCILFSYSWDHNKEFADRNLENYDGVNEENGDYIVKTLQQEEIIASICFYVRKFLLNKTQDIQHIEINGNGEDITAFLLIEDSNNEI